jgi:anti-sigma28 factor (negative regulator of flagellin synthesis)
MRLNLDTSLIQTQDTGAASAAASVTKGNQNGRASAFAASDSVRVSSASSALHQLSADRAARLLALTRAVSEGSYQTSGAEVSSAMIRHAGG